MSKQQTGLRLDRILFRQFKELCSQEKLRPGEVVENIIRAAVDSGTTSFSMNTTGSKGPGHRVDRIVFRSKLSRMKGLLENQRAYLKAVGSMQPFGMSQGLFDYEKELEELAKNCPEEELVQEFEKQLKEMDVFIAEVQKTSLADKLKED